MSQTTDSKSLKIKEIISQSNSLAGYLFVFSLIAPLSFSFLFCFFFPDLTIRIFTISSGPVSFIDFIHSDFLLNTLDNPNAKIGIICLMLLAISLWVPGIKMISRGLVGLWISIKLKYTFGSELPQNTFKQVKSEISKKENYKYISKGRSSEHYFLYFVICFLISVLGTIFLSLNLGLYNVETTSNKYTYSNTYRYLENNTDGKYTGKIKVTAEYDVINGEFSKVHTQAFTDLNKVFKSANLEEVTNKKDQKPDSIENYGDNYGEDIAEFIKLNLSNSHSGVIQFNVDGGVIKLDYSQFKKIVTEDIK